MSSATATVPPAAACRILLIPGFMSPAWMLSPLKFHLRKRFDDVEVWDHPHVFSRPHEVVAMLRQRLQDEQQCGQAIVLITHSFGDWIARRALGSQRRSSVRTVISICPVAAPVPAVRWLSGWARRIVPEAAIMADADVASDAVMIPSGIEQHILWARYDIFIRRPFPWPRQETTHHDLLGTHNSLVFQPSVWKLVTRLVSQPASPRL